VDAQAQISLKCVDAQAQISLKCVDAQAQISLKRVEAQAQSSLRKFSNKCVTLQNKFRALFIVSRAGIYLYFLTYTGRMPQCYCRKTRQILTIFISEATHRPDHSIRIVLYHGLSYFY
jgi:hypothetical protein